MRKFFSLRWRIRGEMDGLERKVDWATRIARHKLMVNKNILVYLFTIDHVRELKFDNKQPGSATCLICLRPGSNWGHCASEAPVMTTTLHYSNLPGEARVLFLAEFCSFHFL